MSYEAMIDALYEELAPLARREPGTWRQMAQAHIIPRALVGAPEAFIAWAEEHPLWRFTVAECATEVCAKPREAAIYIISAMIEELIEDGGHGA